MSTPFVDFYNKNNISPVSQNISDLEKHFNRRESLYLSLGILPQFVKDKFVIEFGPGSGHNALYTSSLLPSHYTLVDGSVVGYEAVKEKFSDNKNIEVVHSLFQNFKSDLKYDILIAEGCLPHQKEPFPLLDYIKKFLTSRGILCLTTMSGVSYLSETLRRLIRDRLCSPNETVEKQLKILVPVYKPHLQTLANMSRPVEDWILDSIIQPLYEVRLLSIPEVINHLSQQFEIIGSSPRFINDWRWYKDINTKDKGFNNAALQSYYTKNLNFLDYRFTYPDQEYSFGKKLEHLCSTTWDIMCAIEKKSDSDWGNLFENLEDIQTLIHNIAPKTSAALLEISSWLKHGDLGKPLTEFNSWWGRGQQYISFIKRD